jgi:hypothetical protein
VVIYIGRLTGRKSRNLVATVLGCNAIHDSTILFKFLGIILRFLRLGVSVSMPSFLPFYKIIFMNKLEFSSLIVLYGFRKPWGACCGFMTGFSPIEAFVSVVFIGKVCICILLRERTMLILGQTKT